MISALLVARRRRKLQGPRSKLQGRSKFQTPIASKLPVSRTGWCLMFGASLDLGVWSLELIFTGAWRLVFGAFFLNGYRFINISFHGCRLSFKSRCNDWPAPLVSLTRQQPINERHREGPGGEAPKQSVCAE